MAVDIQYYFNSILNKEDANLFNRYFSKYNFKNLISASSFFKHLQKDDLKWIYDEDDRGKIYNKAYEVGSKLKEVSPSLKEIYEEDIRPYMDIEIVLYDLEPRVRSSNTILRCPFCGKKEAFIGNKGRGNVIICNRLNKCGRTISIPSYIIKREGTSYYNAIKYIADNSFLDLDSIIASREVHREDSLQEQKRKIEIARLPKKTKEYIEEHIDFNRLNENRFFIEENYKKYIKDFDKLSDEYRYKTILSFIKDFSFRYRDEEKIEEYFINRGITSPFVYEDVGFIPKSRINQLVSELKRVFDEKELIRLNVLSSKGYWKHGTIDKDSEKFYYSDAMVFSMHDIYSSIPTNLEFRYLSNNIKRKTTSMENSLAVTPNYYGKKYRVDNIKNEDIWWFCEGIMDAKSLEQLGYNVIGLIGVNKQIPQNLGFFKDKIVVIALFQYILCFGSSKTSKSYIPRIYRVSIHPMFRFKYNMFWFI